MSERAPILGLDLGTSTCLACVVHEGKTVFVRPDLYYPGRRPGVPDFEGDLMPSAFCNKDGVHLVGQRAIEELTDQRYARNVALEVKRRMHLDGEYTFQLGGKNYSPSRITAEYVKVLVGAAAIELKLPVSTFKKAVVTVPADFSAKARQATIGACVLGGLSEDGVELVDEPVAAAYSLGLHTLPGKQRVLMIDLGGGTFDVALWDVGRDAGPYGFNELGRDGDVVLGGLDWDREIADWTLREIRPRFPDELIRRLKDDLNDPGHNVLFADCERAKKTISVEMKRHRMADPTRPLDYKKLGSLHVSFSPTVEAGKREYSAEMPSDLFFRRTEKLLKGCVDVCHRLFHDIKTIHNLPSFGCSDLDCIYLAGGGSRLPSVPRRFAECWERTPVVNEAPQHAVVKGAAMLAELWRQGLDLPGIISKTRYKRSIGLLVKSDQPGEKPRFHPIIPRNQELPFRLSRTFPILGNPQLRRLRLRFAEQHYHHDGPTEVELQELTIEDLPPSTVKGPEEAEVTVECRADGSPSFQLDFRGLTVSRDLKDLPRATERNGGVNGSTGDASKTSMSARSQGQQRRDPRFHNGAT